MSALSDYAENKLIDFLFRGGTLTPPATWYVALFTGAPGDAAAGTEVSGGSYARVGLAATAANWASTGGAGTTTNPSAGTSGTTSNNAPLAFATPSADWGTVTHLALFDAPTGGNRWASGALATPQSLPSGVPYTLAAGAVTFQIDN